MREPTWGCGCFDVGVKGSLSDRNGSVVASEIHGYGRGFFSYNTSLSSLHRASFVHVSVLLQRFKIRSV